MLNILSNLCVYFTSMKNLILLFLCWSLSANHLLAQDYNILTFGAVADSTSINTIAIQSAIDKAHTAGGGRVIIPEGTFLCGTIVMKTGVEIHLKKNAVLLGSTNIDHYQKMSRWKALIMAEGQTNIAISGKGTIDGQGRELALNIDSLFYIGQIDSAQYTFPEMRPREYLRPQLIEFVNCNNIRVTGVRIQNAASWVQTYHRSKNILIDSVQVISDAYWNNDGIDISDCINVRITNSYVNVADDGICLKSHSKLPYLCDSIYIDNCTVRSSASAIKFGTASAGGFKNVVIKNIKVYDTFRSAIAIETVDGGIIENVLVDSIEAVNTGNAIFVRLGRRYDSRPNGTLKNVVIKNIKAEIAFERPDYAYDIRGPALPFFHNIFPSSITGLPGNPVENIRLENIEIIYPGRGNNGLAHLPVSRLDRVPEEAKKYPEFSMFGELPAWGFYVRHVEGLIMKNIKVSIKEADYRPAFVFDDVKGLRLKAVDIVGDEKKEGVVLNAVEGFVREE